MRLFAGNRQKRVDQRRARRALAQVRGDALIGQAGEQVRGIYEADYRDFNRETYARGRETFDETWAAVKALILGSWRREELAVAQEAAQ